MYSRLIINKILPIFIFLLLINCSQQQARRPLSRSQGSFMKESAVRNLKLVAGEEKTISTIIKSNPEIEYIASKQGYWYYYINKNSQDTIYPKKGDIAYFDYEVADLQGNVIYSQEELQNQTYVIEKQSIMTGLQHGLKMMKKNERVTFLFPSHIAYGYHGDNKKIGANMPLICTVTLNKIQKQKPINQKNNL